LIGHNKTACAAAAFADAKVEYLSPMMNPNQVLGFPSDGNIGPDERMPEEMCAKSSGILFLFPYRPWPGDAVSLFFNPFHQRRIAW
jgi:hypothetical protein